MNVVLGYSRIFILAFFTLQSQAQAPADKIFKKDGTTVAAKVLEILPTEVKYKKASNPDGPTYTILKSEVAKIVYANGEEEPMTAPQASAPQSAAPADEPFGSDNFLTFSDNGEFMITDLTMEDKSVAVCYWDFNMKLKAKYLMENVRGNESEYNWQIAADDGSYLRSSALYGPDNKLVAKFVNPQTQEPFNPKRDVSVLSPDGKRILFKNLSGVNDYSSGSEYVYLFDNTGKVLATHRFKGDWVRTMRFSHNSSQYLIVKEKYVYVYNADGSQYGEIEMETSTVSRYQAYTKYGAYNIKRFVNFSFDNQFIIVSNDQERVSIWDTKGTLVRDFPHYQSTVAAISRDGKWVVTAGCLPYGKTVKRKGSDGVSQTVAGGQLKIWSFDGTLVKEIPFPLIFSSIEFTPDNAGIVGIAEGIPFWLWADENYELEEGMDKALEQLAIDVAKRTEEERKADNARRWGLVLQGFIDGAPKALNNMNAEAAKADKQRKRIAELSKAGKAESSKAAGTGKQDRRLKIAIENKTGKSVENVYISPRESPQWSDDILGKDVLLTGESGTLTIPSNYGKGCAFDLKVVYPDGKTSVWSSLDFCKYYTFQLFPGGKVVFSVD